MAEEKTERNQKWLSLYQRGWTLQEISSQDGVSRERVRQVLEKYNLNGFDIRKNRALHLIESLDIYDNSQMKEKAKLERATLTTLSILRGERRHKIKDGGFLSKGGETEEIAHQKLLELGISNSLMPHMHPFDILLSSNIRVGVKGTYGTCITSKRQISPMYRFRVRKNTKGSYCEFFIFYIESTQDFFVVPDKEVDDVEYVYITWPSRKKVVIAKWQSFHNRFDLLTNL